MWGPIGAADGTLTLWALPVALAAAPKLRCEVDQGGTTQTIEVAPVSDPYGVQGIDINGRFRFKAVVVGDADRINYVALYTWYLGDGRPVLLHEAKYQTPAARPNRPPPHSPASTTCTLRGWSGSSSTVAPWSTSPDEPPVPRRPGSRALPRPHRPGRGQEPTADPTVTLAFVGDINLDGLPGKLVRRGGDPFAPFAALLDGADIRVGNLECVVATRGEPIPKKPYTFRAHPRTLTPAQAALRRGQPGQQSLGGLRPPRFGELLALLDRQGIAYFGGGADLAQEHRPSSSSAMACGSPSSATTNSSPQLRGGLRQTGGRLERGRAGPIRHRRGPAPLRCRSGGPLYALGLGERARRQPAPTPARPPDDQHGHEAMIGSHPHVVQDTETYRGRPMVYGLGNFASADLQGHRQRRLAPAPGT